MKQGAIHELDWHARFTYTKNVPFNEKDLRSAGAKFQIVKFAPNSSIAPHFHKQTTEIFFVESGNGTLVLNETPISLRNGVFVLCEPGDVHSFFAGEEELVVLIFKTNEREDDIYWK